MEGYVAILMPVLLMFVIFFFDNKTKKEKYAAMVEISKNTKDPSGIREILEELTEKKRPLDYRRSGVITLFVGVGLFLFGMNSIDILRGVGLLVGVLLRVLLRALLRRCLGGGLASGSRPTTQVIGRKPSTTTRAI